MTVVQILPFRAICNPGMVKGSTTGMIQTAQYSESQGREKVMVARREKMVSKIASDRRMCLNVVFMSSEGYFSIEEMMRLPG